MPKDIDDDYFYGTGTINEYLEDFQMYEKNGELHLHDTRTNDVVKVTENGSLKVESVEHAPLSTRHEYTEPDGTANSGSLTHPSEERPLTTSDSIYLAVHPDNGDDSVPTEDVDDNNPLQTIEEALSRVPETAQHPVDINLYPEGSSGTLTYTDDYIIGGAVADTGWHRPSEGDIAGNDLSMVRIFGDVDRSAQDFDSGINPGNVVIDANSIELAISNPEIEDRGWGANLSGVTITGRLQCKGGKMGLSHVNFTGERNVDDAISGKNSDVFAHKCDFGNGVYPKAIDAITRMRVILSNCSGTTARVVGKARQGGRIVEDEDSSVRGELGKWEVFNSGRILQDGSEVKTGTVLADDWGDGRLSKRISTNSDSPSDGPGGYRPEWNLLQGSPTAQQGALVLGDGSTTTQKVSRVQPYLAADFELDIQWQTAPTDNLRIPFARQVDTSVNQIWRVMVRNDGALRLQKYGDGGTESWEDVISGSWGGDANPHTIRWTRDPNGNWEMFVDGTSQGTATDTFTPSVGPGYRKMILEDSSPEELHVENVRIESTLQ